MIDFIFAAFPFVVIGVCLAIIFANKEKLQEKNYLLLGMLVGMTIGFGIGALVDHSGIFSTSGLLIGLTIGMFIKNDE